MHGDVDGGPRTPSDRQGRTALATRLRVFFARVGGRFRHRHRDRVLDEELQLHLDCLVNDYVARGMKPEQARLAARRALGGVDAIKEACRDQRGLPLLDALVQDVRFALRLLRRRPGFTMAAAGILAAGIGVNTAFFTIVNAICLRGLPVDRPDEVLFVTTLNARGQPSGMSYADFLDAGRELHAFRGVAAYADAPMTIADEGRVAERVTGTYISAGAFRLLGRPPVLGRDLELRDDVSGAPAVVLLSDAVWRSRYASDPSIVGRTVQVSGVPATVIGVVAERFRFPINSDLWLPLAAMPELAGTPRNARVLSVIGRRQETMSLETVRAELEAFSGRLAAAYPEAHRDTRLTAIPINDQFNGRITDSVWIAFITAGVIVLLVSSANAANLFLLRTAARRRELAIRAAIGASRARLVRQILVECTLFAGLGGGLGLLLSMYAVRLLASSVPSGAPLPFWIEFVPDARVVAAVVAASLLTVFACGLLPAIQGSGVRIPRALGGYAGAPTFRTRWLTSGFLALEFALAFVLIANVTMASARAREWGGQRVTDLTPLLTSSIALPERSYPSTDERRAVYDRLVRQIDALPGVAAAAWTSHIPLGGAARRQLIVEGLEPAPVFAIAAGRDFFDAIGLSLLRGRTFTDRDGLPGADNVIVNQRFAEMHFPGQNVVGARIRIGGGAASPSAAPAEAPPERTIVGVVDSMREWSTDDGVPIVYQPFRGEAPASAVLVVRAAGGEPAALAPALREAVRQLDPDLALHQTMSAEQALYESRWNGRVSNVIIRTISTIALILAVAGLVVVTAHSVTERTPELGLRIAVGAGTARIVRLVLGRALVQLLAGLTLGVALLFALGSIFPLPSSADDAALLAGVILLVAVVGLLACATPALRATRIDPVRALRSE